MSFEMTGKFLTSTDNAIKVTDDETGEELWLPLSQIDYIKGRQEAGCSISVTMTDWIARMKGLM